MPICSKCNKRRRVIQSIKTQNGKKYLVTICAVCKNGIDIEEYKDKKK